MARDETKRLLEEIAADIATDRVCETLAGASLPVVDELLAIVGRSEVTRVIAISALWHVLCKQYALLADDAALSPRHAGEGLLQTAFTAAAVAEDMTERQRASADAQPERAAG